MVNADAHATTQVTRHFAEAHNALRKLGVTRLCEFTARTRQMLPLEPSVLGM